MASHDRGLACPSDSLVTHTVCQKTVWVLQESSLLARRPRRGCGNCGSWTSTVCFSLPVAPRRTALHVLTVRPDNGDGVEAAVVALALCRAKAGLPRIRSLSMVELELCTAEQCEAVGLPTSYAGKPICDALQSLEAAAKTRLAKVVVLAASDKREMAARIFGTQAEKSTITSCTWRC